MIPHGVGGAPPRRRIVQIACATVTKSRWNCDHVIYALASDGSLWANYNNGVGWSKFVDLPQEPA